MANRERSRSPRAPTLPTFPAASDRVERALAMFQMDHANLKISTRNAKSVVRRLAVQQLHGDPVDVHAALSRLHDNASMVVLGQDLDCLVNAATTLADAAKDLRAQSRVAVACTAIAVARADFVNGV